VTGTGSHGDDRVHMRNLFPRFFVTIVVEQNDRREGERMHNRKLRNIRPSGAFSPEMTSSNVTPYGFPWFKSVIWRYKSISFSRIFSNPNVWNATLLVFRISFSPYFFPVLFHTTTFEMQRFSSTWRYKTFHFPVLFQAATFEIQRLKYQLVISLVHDVIKHFIFPYFFKPQRLNATIF
jgi:hypothetical protein